MEDKNVIKLPVTEDKRKAKKRSRSPPKNDPKGEKQLREVNLKRLAVLGEEDGSVKRLEALVFGAEEELLERLVEVMFTMKHLLPASTCDTLNSVCLSVCLSACVRVDMKHRYRRNLMKGDAESVLSKQRLQQRMKEQFQKSMGGTPSWAQKEEEEEEEDDLLRRTGNFVASSESLPCGVLRMKKCLHANSARPSADRLTSVQFHPSAQVVMTAGLDQSVSLFQVDGKTNPKIQSVHLERFPVHQARFSRDGRTVIATSLRNKMFYLYDMMEGRVAPVRSVRGLSEARVKDFSVCPDGGALLLTGTNGYLHMLTLKTNEIVRSMKINGDVSGVAFCPDGSKAFVTSEEGEVFVWDVRSGRCLSRFMDDGCVKGTAIAASPDGRYLACGSQAGVVNVYSQEACLNSTNPKPLRAVMNLLTSATSLTFNPTSEILAVASRVEDEAVRLVHLPSLTVFSNFPVASRKVAHRVSCLDFSPHSGFFSLANNKGHAPLFRLLHYKDF
uniref:U3 small nucleolar RNA-associated protein 18 homolog n=1 Tax=Poecilia reticulata TaxID=8081 RepID=A0A3P9P948_POERE